jgi:hypothetical protein
VLRYVELKTGHHDDGPAWIGRVNLSRSRHTIYFNGKAFKRAGAGSLGNYFDIETGDMYWISGVKHRGGDRHWAGTGKITIEAAAVAEYLELIDATELDNSRFVVSESFASTDSKRFRELENKPL